MSRPGIAQKRLTSHRFHQIPETPAEDESIMASNDVTIDIPLNTPDVGHEHGNGQDQDQQNQQNENQQDRTDAHSKSDSISFFRYHGSMDGDGANTSLSEKTQLVPDCDQGSTGRRRKARNRRGNNVENHEGEHGAEGEGENITRLRRIYRAVINSSLIVRYMIYITPIAILIAIPIIVGATATRYATIGGVSLYWFFGWIEVVWLSLWVCKILARGLPYFFQSLCGIVSPGTRKYALMLRALEIPISLVGWTGFSLVTFFPVCFFDL